MYRRLDDAHKLPKKEVPARRLEKIQRFAKLVVQCLSTACLAVTSACCSVAKLPLALVDAGAQSIGIAVGRSSDAWVRFSKSNPLACGAGSVFPDHSKGSAPGKHQDRNGATARGMSATHLVQWGKFVFVYVAVYNALFRRFNEQSTGHRGSGSWLCDEGHPDDVLLPQGCHQQDLQ